MSYMYTCTWTTLSLACQPNILLLYTIHLTNIITCMWRVALTYNSNLDAVLPMVIVN